MAGRKRKWIRRNRVGERRRRGGRERGRKVKEKRRMNEGETFQPIEKCDRAECRAYYWATHYPVIRPTGSAIIGNSYCAASPYLTASWMSLEPRSPARWQCANSWPVDNFEHRITFHQDTQDIETSSINASFGEISRIRSVAWQLEKFIYMIFLVNSFRNYRKIFGDN